MIYVFDAGPMIAFLKGEPGNDAVTEILIRNPGECYAHVFNLTEVYYLLPSQRRSGGGHGNPIASQGRRRGFWKEVGTYEGLHALSLPDCFCIALSRRLQGTAVTIDHAEFDPLVPLGYCPILFIR